MGLLNRLVEVIIITIVFYLALQAGGLSYIKLQELILTLRHRTIHKCDVSNVCDTLEIRIELSSITHDGLSRI